MTVKTEQQTRDDLTDPTHHTKAVEEVDTKRSGFKARDLQIKEQEIT
jgi:hypothetical protein